jgi:hypothetical protein
MFFFPANSVGEGEERGYVGGCCFYFPLIKSYFVATYFL